MKRNDCDDFPDTVIIGSSALYPLAKGAIQMLNTIIIIITTHSLVGLYQGSYKLNSSHVFKIYIITFLCFSLRMFSMYLFSRNVPTFCFQLVGSNLHFHIFSPSPKAVEWYFNEGY